MTPWALRWNELLAMADSIKKMPIADELMKILEKRYECPRCGRKDLPLYFFFEHNSSCAFECAIGSPAIERIETLETQLGEALEVVQWLEKRLNRKEFDYDARGVARHKMGWAKTLRDEHLAHEPQVDHKDCEHCKKEMAG